MIKISQAETVLDPEAFRKSINKDMEVAREQLKNPKIQVGSKEAIRRRIEIFKDKLNRLDHAISNDTN